MCQAGQSKPKSSGTVMFHLVPGETVPQDQTSPNNSNSILQKETEEIGLEFVPGSLRRVVANGQPVLRADFKISGSNKKILSVETTQLGRPVQTQSARNCPNSTADCYTLTILGGQEDTFFFDARHAL